MAEYLKLSFILLSITFTLYLGFNVYNYAINSLNNANNTLTYSLTIK
jgi:hypothetical protein